MTDCADLFVLHIKTTAPRRVTPTGSGFANEVDGFTVYTLFNNLLPKWLLLPAFRKAHCSCIN